MSARVLFGSRLLRNMLICVACASGCSDGGRSSNASASNGGGTTTSDTAVATAAESGANTTSSGGAQSSDPNTGGAQTTTAAGGTASVGGTTTAGGTAGTGAATGAAGGAGGERGSSLEELQQAFVDLRFGMFIHFGILTYTGEWSDPDLPIDQFDPTAFDAGQWADAAVAANMTFGVLTTRHHDGFALWPSSVGDFNVGNISWMGGQGDVVGDFVEAFRSRGLVVGLYYSIWDNTQGTGNGPINRADLDYIETQLTELLTNYGEIDLLIIDGWSWRMGHQQVAYEEIRELVKSLQPNCLLTDHTHVAEPWDVDIVNFEEPRGVFAPNDNTYAANQEQKINQSGGNDWFWAPDAGSLMSVSDIVDDHLRELEPVWTNFLLNVPPNRDGLIDDNMVERLTEVGAAWSPDEARPPLPSQGLQNEYPYTPVAATATSGNAGNAIDGINDAEVHTIWQTMGALPQSLTLDLGQEYPDVGYLGYVPRYTDNGSSSNGAITSYRVLVSSDGDSFEEVTSGDWQADGHMKVASFGPTSARYVRLEAVAAMGTSAAATEVTVGAVR